MTLKRLFLSILIISTAISSFGQTRFRSGLFLHHSTGACIWGPNGGQVSVPIELAKYNLSHNFHTSDSVQLTRNSWPSADNEWATWHKIFDNADNSNDIRPFFSSYSIIMIKSCFPSSDMSGIGSKSDTSDPTIKSIANYKWHWRSFVSVMKGHPQNFFVIWTNAPLVAGETNPSQAAISDAFCRWAKDTLAAGRDPVFGPFPKNVFVFDFFHLLAGADGMLPLAMAAGSTDSHPNAAATTLVAPQLVKQVFDAALGYETLTGVVASNTSAPATPQLAQNYPNPFNPTTVVSYQLPVPGNVRLVVYDILGREVAVLVNERKAPGSYEARFDATGLASGVYLYRLTTGTSVQTRNMILVR